MLLIALNKVDVVLLDVRELDVAGCWTIPALLREILLHILRLEDIAVACIYLVAHKAKIREVHAIEVAIGDLARRGKWPTTLQYWL